MPPLHYPKSMVTCVILQICATAEGRSIDERLWCMRRATCHHQSLPHTFNTANHQINVHRHGPPPGKTNYLSILCRKVPSTLCLSRLQLVKESIKKTGGGTMEEEQWQKVSGAVSGKLPVHRQHQQARGTKATEQTGDGEFFMFLWVPHKSSPSEVPKYSVP